MRTGLVLNKLRFFRDIKLELTSGTSGGDLELMITTQVLNKDMTPALPFTGLNGFNQTLIRFQVGIL
jgi:hypothetical protein